GPAHRFGEENSRGIRVFFGPVSDRGPLRVRPRVRLTAPVADALLLTAFKAHAVEARGTEPQVVSDRIGFDIGAGSLRAVSALELPDLQFAEDDHPVPTLQAFHRVLPQRTEA